MSLILKILLTLILLPLIYLSSVRLVSQFIVPTDSSSLWTTPSPALYYSAETLPHVLQRLSMLDPLSFGYRILLARSLMAADNPKAAEAIRGAIRVSVVDPEGWVLSGTLQGREGRIEQGVTAFEKAASLDPGRPATFLEEGLYLFDVLPFIPEEKRPLYRSLAELDLDLSLKLAPALAASPHLCLAMAFLLAEKGDKGGAVSYLKRVSLASPINWPLGVRKLALCFVLGERVDALFTWKRILPPKDLSTAQLALIETELQKYSIPEFAYFLADIHVLQGKLDVAQKELTSLVSFQPNVPDYRLALGNVYDKLGRYREAHLSYAKVLELSPSNQEAKRKVIEYYARGKREEGR
jgi:tetratricopeptide (TPR) repeat protein